MAQQQGPTVHYKLLNYPGIRSVPARDAAVRSALGRSLQDVQASGLEPYGIAVFNDTDRTIIAAVLRTTLVDRNGKANVQETIFNNLRLKRAGGVTPNGNEIAPRSSRILTPLKSFSDGDGSAASLSSGGSAYASLGGSSPFAASSGGQDLAQQHTVVVALDLIMFEDGRLLGPDEGNLRHSLQAQLQVERELALMLKDALASSKDMREVRDMLTRHSKTEVRPRVAGNGAVDHWRDFFTVLTSNYYLNRATSREALVAAVAEVLDRPVLKLIR